jgi:hypothetical protein
LLPAFTFRDSIGARPDSIRPTGVGVPFVARSIPLLDFLPEVLEVAFFLPFWAFDVFCSSAFLRFLP